MNLKRTASLAAVAATVVALACSEPTAPEGTVIVVVVAGNAFSCGLDAKGLAYCWGYNEDGELGRGTTGSFGTAGPVAGGLTFTTLDAGDSNVCGLVDGTAYCWGSGALFNAQNPVATPTAVEAPGVSFTAITVGGRHACGLTSAGAAWCWGLNTVIDGGQLGDGTMESSGVAREVVGGVSFDGVSAGFLHTCGVAGGEVWCWGSNYDGSLGLPDVKAVAEPTKVPLTVTASSVHVGAGFTCVEAAGAVHCWGTNLSGQLGRGTAGVGDTIAQPVAGSTLLTSLATGAVNRTISHACALDADGRAFCWGANDEDQLGRVSGTLCTSNGGDIYCGMEPDAVETQLRFEQVAVGADHSCAVASGAVYCWGNNADGQLGSTVAGSRVPIEVVIE